VLPLCITAACLWHVTFELAAVWHRSWRCLSVPESCTAARACPAAGKQGNSGHCKAPPTLQWQHEEDDAQRWQTIGALCEGQQEGDDGTGLQWRSPDVVQVKDTLIELATVSGDQGHHIACAIIVD
jgi:hypothetical protein